MNPLIQNLIARVMQHEGTYDSVNRNTDGAGASVGIFQWPQRTGGLGQLLAEYHRADPRLFVQIFGPASGELLKATHARSMGPVAGALLWHEPWVSRFQAAGRQAAFRAVQDRLATQGTFMKAAFQAAQTLGLPNERTLCVTLDAAVSQGPEFAVNVARAVARGKEGSVWSQKALLDEYLRVSVAHFRRTEPPARPPKSKHLRWEPVAPEWHIFAGRVNLFRNIMRRRGAYLTDDTLSDQALNLQAVMV